ncbi:hypothetical protein [Streptomyces sp. NPDC048603]|uniref:DUF7144 family membrane protein n=1 Tax=Streptomyces sp. NPDC048603 TaxID=3365577 RepID=UPI0037174E30
MTSTHSRADAHPFASGLVVFASVMLIVFGALDFCRGIMGIARDEVFVTTANYVFKFDLTTWGWLHLVFGAFAVVVGIGLMTPSTWARVGGIGLSAVLIIINFLSLPYFPLWSLVAIAVYGVIIWALCVVKSPET